MKLWIAVFLILMGLNLGFIIGCWFATLPKQDEIEGDE